MAYFEHFPKIEYDNRIVTNIARRVKILDDLRNDPYAFLPYTIKDDERPEDVAYYYYGDQHMVWAVYLSNNIIDPYYQWPLNNRDFERTMIAKYSRPDKDFEVHRDGYLVSENHGYDNTDPVILNGDSYYIKYIDADHFNLSQTPNGPNISISEPGILHFFTEVYLENSNIDSNILYSVSNEDRDIRGSVDTYLEDPVNWTPIRIYEHEMIENESRRTIWLINNQYVSQLKNDLKRVIND